MMTKESEKTYEKVYTFAELHVAPILKNNLAHGRFVTPTPVQAASLLPALAGRDILGTSQTGTGKTLAFLLPILERLMHTRGRDIEALVLVPTRELAMQVLDMLQHLGRGSGIPAVLVVGGLSESRQLGDIRRGARFVIATPGRLDDYVKRKLVHLKAVKFLVLDEADRMVDMGFLPQMKNIMNTIPKERQTMCFSATMDASVSRLVREYLHNPIRVEIGSTLRSVESVALKVYEVRREQKLGLLEYLLKNEQGTFLVFARTKHGADKLARKLARAGFDADALHGGKSQAQRTKALAGFKAGKHRILVATDIAARGIHVQNIAHVINFDLPQAAEDFIHRVGRTGRLDKSGIATTFVMPEEFRDLRDIERTLGKNIERLKLPSDLPVEVRSFHADDAPRDFRRTRVAPRSGHFSRQRRR